MTHLARCSCASSANSAAGRDREGCRSDASSRVSVPTYTWSIGPSRCGRGCQKLSPENGVHGNWAIVSRGGCHFTVTGPPRHYPGPHVSSTRVSRQVDGAGQTGEARLAVRQANAIRDALVAGDSQSPVALNFKRRVDALEHTLNPL